MGYARKIPGEIIEVQPHSFLYKLTSGRTVSVWIYSMGLICEGMPWTPRKGMQDVHFQTYALTRHPELIYTPDRNVGVYGIPNAPNVPPNFTVPRGIITRLIKSDGRLEPFEDDV